jgi:hypothetical protein
LPKRIKNLLPQSLLPSGEKLRGFLFTIGTAWLGGVRQCWAWPGLGKAREPSMIYVLQMRGTDFYKIGFTSKDTVFRWRYGDG